MADPAGLVLAGGASRRMGRDKARLVLGGRSLLDSAIDVLRTVGADPVRVSGNYPDYCGIPDAAPGLGPLGGIRSVLRAEPELAGRWLVVIPVDMPFLDPAALRELLDVAAENGRGAIFQRHPMPLVVRIGPGLWQALDEALVGSGSVQGVVGRLGLATLTPPDPRVLENLNAPENLERARLRFEGSSAAAVSARRSRA